MRIVEDNRKQAPFTFSGLRYEDVTVEVGTLAVVDYSLAGLTDKVVVERKSLPDLAYVGVGSANALSESCNAGRRWMPSPWSWRQGGLIWGARSTAARPSRTRPARVYWLSPDSIASPYSLPGAERRQVT